MAVTRVTITVLKDPLTGKTLFGATLLNLLGDVLLGCGILAVFALVYIFIARRDAITGGTMRWGAVALFLALGVAGFFIRRAARSLAARKAAEFQRLVRQQRETAQQKAD